ncbi:hypothetical protein JKP88DRAFT_311119 [Tribonema minus]|uniref:DH domain-containing protein n=1 Tax=Tribonema minus TaxID=303371 RepID=A0A835Z6E2_9STRA|nr:hypothetical protein JKP88DRAFT_311119 [Tribonema minus]
MGNVAGVEDALLSDDAVPELEPRSPGGRGGGARAQPQQQHGGGGGGAAAAAGTSLECVNLRSPSAQRGGAAAAAAAPQQQQQHHTRWQTDRNYLPGELERRRRALDELLSSERTYVACLETLVDTFVAPLNAWADEIEARRGAAEEEDGGGGGGGALRKGGGGGGEGEAPEVTRAELLSVFSNTEQIAAFNRQLLLDLERARRDGGNKAMLDQLLKAAPFFKMYGTFVRNFEVRVRVSDRNSSYSSACAVRLGGRRKVLEAAPRALSTAVSAAAAVSVVTSVIRTRGAAPRVRRLPRNAQSTAHSAHLQAALTPAPPLDVLEARPAFAAFLKACEPQRACPPQTSERRARRALYSTQVSRETLNALEARPAFAVFLKACELQRACRGLQLRDLLIMPVQRIPRYRLLLETMVRHTKDADPLSRGLAENLAQMSTVVDQINQDVHKMERRNRVLALQYQFAEEWVAAARTLVKDGPLTKVCRGGPRRFQFVLFSDLLVYGSETLMGKWGKRQYKMNRALELARCYVVDGLAPGAVVPAGAEEAAFMVLSADKCFVVQASDAVEKAEWVAALRGAMDALATKVIHAAGGPSGDGGGGSGHGSLLKVPLMAKAKKKKAAAAAAAAMAVAVEDTSALAKKKKAAAAAAAAMAVAVEDTNALRSCSLWVMSTEGRVTRAAFLLPRAPSLRVTYRSVLGSPRQRALFRQHLEATHCEENLDFCEAVAKYAAAAASGAGQQGRVAAARALMDRFIADGAPQQVNLSESMREERCQADADRKTHQSPPRAML